MQWVEKFANNQGVRLHYLDSGGLDSGGQGEPALFVPGFGEEAAEHTAVIEALAPRRTLVVDLRGRGRSDAPASGYSLAEHIADMEAIVAAAGVERVHLASYSRGTSYALGWATRHPEQVASLTIGDYPARQIKPPAWFAEKAPTRDWRGRPIVERMSAPAIAALIGEAVDIELWDRLDALDCPVLLIRGGAPGAIVDDALEARYRDHLGDLTVECFEDSAHDLWDPDPHRFVRTWHAFLAKVE
ncbi:MAG: alpha/beta fold hydrolase [Acidimicrobiales bacterium]|nr:alpha/beta fold hydrolase [Acidimicrobiales bacterium]